MHELRQIARPEPCAATASHSSKLNTSVGTYIYVLCLSDSTVDVPEDKGP